MCSISRWTDFHRFWGFHVRRSVSFYWNNKNKYSKKKKVNENFAPGVLFCATKRNCFLNHWDESMSLSTFTVHPVNKVSKGTSKQERVNKPESNYSVWSVTDDDDGDDDGEGKIVKRETKCHQKCDLKHYESLRSSLVMFNVMFMTF